MNAINIYCSCKVLDLHFVFYRTINQFTTSLQHCILGNLRIFWGRKPLVLHTGNLLLFVLQLKHAKWSFVGRGLPFSKSGSHSPKDLCLWDWFWQFGSVCELAYGTTVCICLRNKIGVLISLESGRNKSIYILPSYLSCLRSKLAKL